MFCWSSEFISDSNNSQKEITDINNENNVSDKESSDSPKDDTVQTEKQCQESCLYIRDGRNNNQMYLLKFKAVDIRVLPLYLEHRVFEQQSNDKCVQPRSNLVMVNKVNVKAKRFNVLYKTYVVDPNNDRLSIMTSKKPLMKSTPRAPVETEEKVTISNKSTSFKRSVIHINSDLNIDLFPGIIDIKQVRPLYYETKEEQHQLMEELGMEPTESMHNKANFVVKVKRDVLKVTFTLEDISFEPVTEKITVSSQVVDDNCYIKGFSMVTKETVYFSIPKATYNYIDPMVKVRNANMSAKLANQEPHWMQGVRNKRINDYNKARVTNPYRNIRELVIGSSITFEANDCLHKARTGSIKSNVDNSEYEKWAIEKLKLDYIVLEEEAMENS